MAMTIKQIRAARDKFMATMRRQRDEEQDVRARAEATWRGADERANRAGKLLMAAVKAREPQDRINLLMDCYRADEAAADDAKAALDKLS